MNKIKWVSRCFRILFQAAFVCVIFAQIIGWITVSAQNDWLNTIPHAYQAYLLSEIDISKKVLGFFITSFPTVALLFVFYFLIKLFHQFERQKIFLLQNVHYIRNTGYALLAQQCLKHISDFLLGFLLTANNPPGLRFAEISFTEWNIELTLTAFIIILISWVMAEGEKLYHDQQLTI